MISRADSRLSLQAEHRRRSVKTVCVWCGLTVDSLAYHSDLRRQGSRVSDNPGALEDGRGADEKPGDARDSQVNMIFVFVSSVSLNASTC